MRKNYVLYAGKYCSQKSPASGAKTHPVLDPDDGWCYSCPNKVRGMNEDHPGTNQEIIER